MRSVSYLYEKAFYVLGRLVPCLYMPYTYIPPGSEVHLWTYSALCDRKVLISTLFSLFIYF